MRVYLSIALFVVLVIALVCLPWMLLVNPYLEWKAEQDKQKQRAADGGDVELSRMRHSYQV